MIWSVYYHTERWRRNNDRASGFVQRCAQFLQSEFITYLQVPFCVTGKKIIYISSATASNNIRDFVYVCPCFIYEIDERYPLDATIYLLL